MTTKGWYGVDLDGVLADWDELYFPEIGPPIPEMIERVQDWLRGGKDVRIFTARVSCCGRTSEHGTANIAFAADQRQRIEAWCTAHLGTVLPVTAEKDFLMVELWDDRCVQVVTNTGRTLREELTNEIMKALREPPG